MKIIKIKKSGFIFIVLTIFLGFAGINTGNNLIYLITSTLLGFMAISGFFGKRNINNLEIKLEFPEEIFAKTKIPVKVSVVNNRGFLPAFLIKVHIFDQSLLFPFVNCKNFKTKTISTYFPKRGNVAIKHAKISSTFPYNFFIRYSRIILNKEKIVFPEPEYSPLIQTIFSNGEQTFISDSNISNRGISGELLFIREYNNDPIKLIHWKSSAKLDKFMVKELSSEIRNSILIDFEKININNIEKKLSIITYLIIKLERKGICVNLKLNKEIYTNRKSMLRALALYNLG